ncbi:MAG: HAMP domain-containing sensor histidine kinase [Isosphaeraceae bacterium]
MRLSIRDQVLIPLVTIQALTVCAITAATATLAARRNERQIIDRVNGVVGALGHTNFPYTRAVLARMRGLSGAEFVAYEADGRVGESSFPALRDVPPALASVASNSRLDSLGESPTVQLDGVRYFAVPVRPPGGSAGPSLLILYPETSWRQARREAATVPLLLGGASLVLMVAVTGWIAFRLSRRVRALGARVARIADGDFSGLDPGRQRDEIADLARSINAMCDQLRDMSRAVRQSERTRLLAQLAAGLAHQLRNSLTGARMSVQLHERRCPAAGPDRSLAVALRQLTVTEEQVKGLLSLGRVEQRPPTRFDLRRLVGDIALLVGPACEHARVALDAPPGDAPLEVVADEAGLRAAVLNLVLNAAEAAGHGGTVRLRAEDRDGRTTVEVRDTGPGPPAELAGTLFEPFATSKPEGVGLGLALAHDVATSHGGTLAWDRDGGETRFRLTLPATPDATRPHA